MRRFLVSFVFVTTIVFFTISSIAQAAPQTGGMQSNLGEIRSIKYAADDSEEQVSISFDRYGEYRTMRLSDPERIVIDFANTRAPKIQQVINVNSKLIKLLRYAQFEDGVARVVIDSAGYLDYMVEEQNNSVIIHLREMGNLDDLTLGGISGKDSDSSRMDSGLLDRGVVNRDDIFTIDGMKVNYSGKGSIDEIHIRTDKYENYKAFTLSNPERIVIDIPNRNNTSSKEDYRFEIGKGLVKSIRYARHDRNTIRVVVDVSSPVKYRVEEGQGELVLKIDNPHYKNILYHNSGDRVYFTLRGAKLTEGGETLKKFYKGEFDSSGTKYTLTFPSKLADLNSGFIRVNDSLLDSLEILKSSDNSNTSIIFNAKDKFHYEVFTRTGTNDTAITILKPSTKLEKLVVIDPGHGGYEPGAIYKSVYEKDLNLDIALRLNKLLKEKSVKTYMLREDDSYVALYERAYIANSLNASLFLSIHNNAMGNTSYGGTMTLCYPERPNSKGFTGRTFAQIVQDNLLGKLGTTDRKVIDRPNLVVLKATKMPAALAEVAFITNADDRSKLQSTTFRQKAAQALCDSIIKSLAEIDKFSGK